MPTRIIFHSKNSIVVSETLDEVNKKLESAKNPMDTLIFYDNENRYNSDRRVVVVASHVDYARPERVSI